MKLFQLHIALLVGLGLTLAADVALKESTSGNLRLFSLGLLLYASVALPVAVAFRFAEFGTLFLMWEGLYVTSGVILGHLVFRESMNAAKIASLVFALMSLVMAYRS
jgi:multidrug transporter EmrE-like cation transporter